MHAPGQHAKSAPRGLAAALVAAALFGVAPAVYEIIDYLRFRDAVDVVPPGRWLWPVILLSVIQAAHAVYLWQVPHWASVRVITLELLVLAGLYAMALGGLLVADPEGWLAGPQGLQLGDKLAGGKAALWCACMASVSAILAFFAGRFGHRWRRAESVLQHVRPERRMSRPW